MALNNTTAYYNDGVNNITLEELNYRNVEQYCAILHPVIYTMGFTGNVMNLVVFTRQRMRHGKTDVEKAATTGLMFLAVSDMMYCFTGLITYFLLPFKCASFYYSVYKTALLNTCQFSSTWQTVTVAVERYMAVSHPFQARQTASAARTTVHCAFVFLFSVVFSIPFFFEYGVSLSGTTYMLIPGPMADAATFKFVYIIVWSIFGIFIPFVTLAFCNVRFLVVIYHSQARFTNTKNGENSRRNPLLNSTTVTFALIICLFFVLVCPAMVLKFIEYAVLHVVSDKWYYRFMLTIVITNTMLAVNFAVNFLLYCYALRDFRKTLMNMPRCSSLLCLRQRADQPSDNHSGRTEATVTGGTDIVQYHACDVQDTRVVEMTICNSRLNDVSCDGSCGDDVV